MKNIQYVFLSLLVAGLTACGTGNEPPPIPVQHWQEMDVRIETHPNPPLDGMSEIVVITTGPHGRPVSDLLVSLRSNDLMPWVQTIQDGYIGVYRRSVDLGEGDATTLQVLLQRGNDQKILLFPLKLAEG